ncbi:MAG: rRNA pseudouridine synthase [Lachnospiraceae bacterium]|jgi:23S rRNA pseudouridine2604 synthase|nr:rRNA pseudouridine synthase [Lachnospiraceae bacterium]
MDEIRINKYIALCGICSRREADGLIENGRVTINGQKAELGSKVKEGDTVLLDQKEVKPEEKKVVAYYKPVGVTCTEADVHANVTLSEAFHYPTRLTYAGRLDEDSEGLLIMTNDGDLIHVMMCGSNNHEKEYLVEVDKDIDPQIFDRMRKGIFLFDLDVETKPCKVESVNSNTFKITLTQGLNRQIRRMCFECGLDVVSLKRIRVCNILLGDLKPNEYREIEGEELKQLYDSVFKSESE